MFDCWACVVQQQCMCNGRGKYGRVHAWCIVYHRAGRQIDVFERNERLPAVSVSRTAPAARLSLAAETHLHCVGYSGYVVASAGVEVQRDGLQGRGFPAWCNVGEAIKLSLLPHRAWWREKLSRGFRLSLAYALKIRSCLYNPRGLTADRIGHSHIETI